MVIFKPSGGGSPIKKLLIVSILFLLNPSSHGDQDANEDDNWECGFEDEMKSRTAIWEQATLWPNGRVAYELDPGFDDKGRAEFAFAVEDFRNNTCIRWEERNPGEEAFVNVYINYNTSYGGLATICCTGKKQKLYVRYDHVWRTVILHEMLHTMCFFHEMNRHDRDEFISYADCNDPTKIPRIQDKQAVRPDLYDYLSLSHYGCNGGCEGTPTMFAGFTRCGQDGNKKGLSVLDSDKLNDVYDCKGCHRHRWHNIETLTDEQSRHIVEFAPLGSDTEPIYICRGYDRRGEIVPGRYRPETKICEICVWTTLYNVTKHTQVLTIPSGPYIISASSQNYQMYDSKDMPTLLEKNMLTPVGRSTGNSKMYLGLFTNASVGADQTLVGFVYAKYATSCFNSRDIDTDIFQVFGCSM